jgi:two-component system, sensor histidine kinase and response regulator
MKGIVHAFFGKHAGMIHAMAFEKNSILIAEDDPVLREAYIRRFKLTDFVVSIAENGDMAAKMIRQRTPDLLICDIMMPVHDGIWVLQQFPKKSRTFPVIMLTNLADDETREKCKKLGMDDYFVKKDMSLHSLIEMAERLLKQSPKKVSKAKKR